MSHCSNLISFSRFFNLSVGLGFVFLVKKDRTFGVRQEAGESAASKLHLTD
jgi:hypothetical protein